MKIIIDFFTSETAGFMLKLFSGFAAAAFGILGIGSKTRADNGKLTRNGWIALIGIVLSGILAVSTSVYDFVRSQKKEEADHEYSLQVLHSVQSGLYPLRDMRGTLSILLTEPFPGLAQYKSMLRRSLPATAENCENQAGYVCSFTSAGLQYDIPAHSPLFPKSVSMMRSVIDGLGLRISVMAGSGPGDRHFRKLGVFVSPFRRLAPDSLRMRVDLQNNRVEYVLPLFTIPNDFAKGLEAYSLVEILPGFMYANVELAGNPPYCHKFSPNPDRCFGDLFNTANKGMALENLWLAFEYPKALTFDQHSAFNCPTKDVPTPLILMLPEDINSLDTRGAYIPPAASEDLKKSVCEAFNN